MPHMILPRSFCNYLKAALKRPLKYSQVCLSGVLPYQSACHFSKSFVFLIILKDISTNCLSEHGFIAIFNNIQRSSILVKIMLIGSVSMYRIYLTYCLCL